MLSDHSLNRFYARQQWLVAQCPLHYAQRKSDAHVFNAAGTQQSLLACCSASYQTVYVPFSQRIWVQKTPLQIWHLLQRQKSSFWSGRCECSDPKIGFLIFHWHAQTVYRGCLPPMSFCMQWIHTLVSCRVFFRFPLQCFSESNDTVLEMISFLTAHNSRETHCHATPMHISIWSHCMVNEQQPLSNMIISLPFMCCHFSVASLQRLYCLWLQCFSCFFCFAGMCFVCCYL